MTSVNPRPRYLVLFLLALIVYAPGLFAQKKEKLAANYRDWLDHDVVYIITKDERQRFLVIDDRRCQGQIHQ